MVGSTYIPQDASIFALSGKGRAPSDAMRSGGSPRSNPDPRRAAMGPQSVEIFTADIPRADSDTISLISGHVGINGYAYVRNDPIGFVDPSGLAVGDWWDLFANLDRSRQIAGQKLSRRPTSHNDFGDAMRHAEWMQRTTYEINNFTAWIAGDRHEIEGILMGQPMNEMIMYLNNNAVGRETRQKCFNCRPEQTLPITIWQLTLLRISKRININANDEWSQQCDQQYIYCYFSFWHHVIAMMAHSH